MVLAAQGQQSFCGGDLTVDQGNDRAHRLFFSGNHRDRGEQKAGVVMLRCLEDLRRGASLDNLAKIQNADLLGKIAHQGQVMRDEQEGQVQGAAKVGQQVHHTSLHRDVQGRGRLVQHQQSWGHGQGACNGHPLFLAAGQFMGIPLGEIARQLHHVQEFADPTRLVGARKAMCHQGNGDGLCHSPARVQGRTGVLEHHLHTSAMRPRADLPGNVLSVDQDRTRGGAAKPHDHPRDGRFSRTGFARQPVNLTLFDGKGDIGHRPYLAGQAAKGVASREGLGQVANIQHRCHSTTVP